MLLSDKVNYMTIHDYILLQLSQKYSKDKLIKMTSEEIQGIINKLMEPINKDFISFYGRCAELDVTLNKKHEILVFKGKNVLGWASLYRSIEDIWDFYDPDNDIYEDGFLRISNVDGKIIIKDYLEEFQK
jgi:hypothetical protein